MRRKKNIILNLRNTTSHFTGKEKIITLAFAIIMLSFTNITLCFSNLFSNSNVSALSYQSNVGVSFTFDPTLSVNISPSNLTINNLTPGTTSDSNVINISVATNAAYGYTLSAIMNGNNNNLTHTNDTNTFSSIATDSSLPNLVMDNTWGYSYKLSNDTNWNNYSGLSTETSKPLVDSSGQTAIPIDFKIGAKASGTQPSGTYAGTINFTAVTKLTPMNLAESYFAVGKTKHNGYYAMQDMTSEICNNTEVIGEGSQTELIDLRDNKIYWATKLADGHCWMTQNLDLDLDSNRTYTHWDTDLGWNDPDNLDINANWKPDRSTIDFTIGSTISGWQSSGTEPYSANPGDVYFYTSNSDANDIQYDSLQECVNAGHNDCTHYHAGNYYNWSAAVASNDTSGLTSQYDDAQNSICPTGWTMPVTASSRIDFRNLVNSYKISPSSAVSLRQSPLYFTRSSYINSFKTIGREGFYSSRNANSQSNNYSLYFNSTQIITDNRGNGSRPCGFSVRCLAR